MANLSVRKLDDSIYQKLRACALQHGVSMEEEVRQIVTRAVTAPAAISGVFKKHFGSKNGINFDEAHQRKPHESVDFSE